MSATVYTTSVGELTVSTTETAKAAEWSDQGRRVTAATGGAL